MDIINNTSESVNIVYPESFSRLHGNEHIKSYLSSAIRKNSLSHAYVIEGGSGSGRHTLCYSLACALAPKFTEKILSGNEADISVICHDEKHKTIGVEIIRNLKSDASISPNDLDFRMFIIEEADSMTPQAQNALLKLLEEPPASVYIILLCENIGGLLPTVLSRAPVLRMQQFGSDELADYILKNDKKSLSIYSNDRETFDFAIRTSNGRIGEVLRRLKGKGKVSGESSAAEKVHNILDCLSYNRKADFFTEMSSLPGKREEMDLFLAVFEEALHDLLCAKAFINIDEDYPMLYYTSLDEAKSAAEEFTNAALLNMSERVTAMHETLDMNANIRLLGTVLSEQIWSAIKL